MITAVCTTSICLIYGFPVYSINILHSCLIGLVGSHHGQAPHRLPAPRPPGDYCHDSQPDGAGTPASTGACLLIAVLLSGQDAPASFSSEDPSVGTSVDSSVKSSINSLSGFLLRKRVENVSESDDRLLMLELELRTLLDVCASLRSTLGMPLS